MRYCGGRRGDSALSRLLEHCAVRNCACAVCTSVHCDGRKKSVEDGRGEYSVGEMFFERVFHGIFLRSRQQVESVVGDCQ